MKFVIERKYITPYQLEQIKNHINVARNVVVKNHKKFFRSLVIYCGGKNRTFFYNSFGYIRKQDEWRVKIGMQEIEFSNTTNTFEMKEFLGYIGVAKHRITHKKLHKENENGKSKFGN